MLLLWWAGANLRLALLAVPPVLPLIHDDLHLSEKMVGALSGLPILLFALAAVSGSLLTSRFGAKQALIVGLLLVGIGSALRGIGPSIPILFIMTFVVGVGIAMMQPILPALVREWFPTRMAGATAVYTNGLLVGEILSSSLTIPFLLPMIGSNWQLSFVVWAIPALLTALAMALFAPPSTTVSRGVHLRWWPDWSNPRIWAVGLIFGGAGVLYFTANAFLPDYLQSQDRADLIGHTLASLNVSMLPATFLVVAFPNRLIGRPMPLAIVGVIGIISVLGLTLTSTGFGLIFWSGMIGFCAAFVMTVTLGLPPLLSEPHDVHRFSAGAFTISYLFSFVTPVLGGVAW